MSDIASIYSQYYHVIIAIACSTFFGMCAGAIGSLSYLKRQSMLADTLSHATLPGVVCSLFLVSQPRPWILLCGAIISAAAAMGASHYIKTRTHLSPDAILAVILSVFLGFGLLLISMLQKFPRADQGLINKFLFGNASLLLISDFVLIAGIGSFLVLFMIIFFKELIMGIFDETCARTSGFSLSLINCAYSVLLVGIIALGIQTVGIILMSSQLIAPSVAARQWTDSIKSFIWLSACIGVACALAGSLISFYARTPTGPTLCIVLFINAGCSLWLKNMLMRRASV